LVYLRSRIEDRVDLERCDTGPEIDLGPLDAVRRKRLDRPPVQIDLEATVSDFVRGVLALTQRRSSEGDREKEGNYRGHSGEAVNG
jgi:hypothetical protein